MGSLLRATLAALMLFAAGSLAQTTQPTDSAALELRATTALNEGQYAIALPLLKKLAEQAKDEPDKVLRLREQIRVCERELSVGATLVSPSDEQRKPHVAPEPGGTLEITIQELGNFDYDAEKGGNIPDDVQKLSGSSIRVRGFMIPMDQADNVTQFALVPDLFACCFGQPPQLQHTVVATCPPGKAVTYYPDELIVEGTLKVEEKRDEGFIISVFEMNVSSVKPAAH